MATSTNTLYSNLPASIVISGTTHYFAATSASISLSPKIEADRNLSSLPPLTFKVGGNLETKISLSFLAVHNDDFTAARQVVSILTGDLSSNIIIGGETFESCYLDNLSIEMVPFLPVMINADFTTFKINYANGVSSTPTLTSLPKSGICYGHNIVASTEKNLTPTKESLSYKVSCSRTPRFRIGDGDSSFCFLDSVEKELSIKSNDIEGFMDFKSFGAIVYFDLKTESGISLTTSPISFSNNSKLSTQNLSINAEDVLAGQVTLREIVL